MLSHFDKNDGSEGEIENTSLHHHLNKNHDIAGNEVKIESQLPLEHIFGFCRTFKEITKQLRFHVTLKTTDL